MQGLTEDAKSNMDGKCVKIVYYLLTRRTAYAREINKAISDGDFMLKEDLKLRNEELEQIESDIIDIINGG